MKLKEFASPGGAHPSRSLRSTTGFLSSEVSYVWKGAGQGLTVSIIFLLLHSPEGLKNAVPRLVLEEIPWYRIFMNFTSYLNHSINGVLYCIVGTRFRLELYKIFC